MEGTATTVEKGRVAEDIAARWLKVHGLRILERNYRHNHLEIDIIAEGPLLTSEGTPAEGTSDKSFLHIVEVRSRAEGSIVSPEKTILLRKQKLLISAADAFARSARCHLEVVFDVIGIETGEHGYALTFTPEAFRPKW